MKTARRKRELKPNAMMKQEQICSRVCAYECVCVCVCVCVRARSEEYAKSVGANYSEGSDQNCFRALHFGFEAVAKYKMFLQAEI